jgi:hypothetical protein
MRAFRQNAEINMALIQTITSLNSSPIHPVAGSMLRTGRAEPLVKVPRSKMGHWKTGEIKMKKIIVLFAFICALGAFASRPSADVPRHAAMETMPLLAMMQAPQWLPTEAYDAN